MISILKNVASSAKPYKYSQDQLTEEQINKAVEDIGLDDSKLNLVALYALSRGKYVSLGDALFDNWMYELKKLQKYSGLEIPLDSSATSGLYYNNSSSTPKTIKETMDDANDRILKLEESTNNTSQIETIKSKIGVDLFEDAALTGVEKTISQRLTAIESSIKQLAADIFNKDSKRGDKQNEALYNLRTDRQTVDATIVDTLEKILKIHGGTNNPTHSYINEEVVMDFSSSKITINPKETVFIFPNNNNKHQSHADQVSTWKYRVSATISNLMAHISRNDLNGSATVSLYINGAEQPKKISIGPNALGSYDITEMGTSVKFMDRLAIKITTESASQGSIDIDSTALTIIKGPK